MVFGSIPFAIFLPVVFCIYWIVGSQKINLQNSFLLLAGYFFYSWWNWKFLALLVFLTVFSYLIGVKLDKTIDPRRRKLLVWSGVSVALLILCFFKYFNFFVDSFITSFTLFGKQLDSGSLKIILPLGISFYTFKVVGYLFDVYSSRIKACNNFLNYSLFVSFFPQVVAGPIEKAEKLLPQIESCRTFNYIKATDGLKLILWGLFKKIVIADSCAFYANDIFLNYEGFPASVLLLGTVYFAFQVYADFSGYSDIAMGVAKLLGFEIMLNFNRPFVSKNVTDFWRRWHISISVWFNDYVFTPVYTAIRNWGKMAMYISIFITFSLSGIWHGEQWHFLMFGMIHAVALIYEAATKKSRKKIAAKINPALYNGVSIFLTFSFLLITWIMFRADSVTEGWNYLTAIFDSSILQVPGKLAYLPLIALLVIWEWLQSNRKHALDFSKMKLALRWGVYLTLTFSILYFYGQEQAFYYFKF